MIKITIGNNVAKNTIIVDDSTTVGQAFEAAHIERGNGVVSFNGTTLSGCELSTSVGDLASRYGIDTSKTLLIRSIVKADNA